MNLITVGLPLAQTAPTNVEQQTAAPGATTGPGGDQPPAKQAPGWTVFLPWILIAVVFYLFLLRPKNKQEKQRVAMLSSLKKGDRIQTIGGILGTVVEAREDEVVVKVDESSNTKITFSRNAIHRVREEEKT